MNDFFFITSHGRSGSLWLSSILNRHHDIICSYGPGDPFLEPNEEITKEIRVWKNIDIYNSVTIDEFIKKHKELGNARFIGNVRAYTARNLHIKSLEQRSLYPFRRVNVIRHPINRVESFFSRWHQAAHDNTTLQDTIINNAKNIVEYKDILQTLKDVYDVDFLEFKNQLFVYSVLQLWNDHNDLNTPGENIIFEKLVTDIDYFAKFFKNLTRNKLELTDEYLSLVTESSETYRSTIDAKLPKQIIEKWEEWQNWLFRYVINSRQTLLRDYRAVGYEFDGVYPPVPKRDKNNLLVSIQLNSNRPNQLNALFDNLEDTADNPKCFEVLVNIDEGDMIMEDSIKEQIKKRPFRVKYITSVLHNGFFDLWKPLNSLLKISDPDAYYLFNISDEFLFKTKGWDSIIKKYIGFYPDDIFRLRGSVYKFRNYFDFWECGFAPDSLCFYSRKWIMLGGDWNPCLGPDSFQQCVAYYLWKHNHFTGPQTYRDIVLTEIEFYGEGASIGLSENEFWGRMYGHVIAWFELMSHRTQQEAYRRAMHLQASVDAYVRNVHEHEIRNLPNRRVTQLVDKHSGEVVSEYSYALNWWKISFINQWRKLHYFRYAGGGKGSVHGVIFNLTFVTCAKYRWMRKVLDKLRIVTKPVRKSLSKVKSVIRGSSTIIRKIPHVPYVMDSTRLIIANPVEGMRKAKRRIKRIAGFR